MSDVVADQTWWNGSLGASEVRDLLKKEPVNGIYMQAGGVFLAPVLDVLRQAKALVPPSDPKHAFVISNDGIPSELAAIRAGEIDATVSQPADLYAKYALFYAQAALQGKTFQPGLADHDSTIVRLPNGLEDQLPGPLVTRKNVDDPALWGNQMGQ